MPGPSAGVGSRPQHGGSQGPGHVTHAGPSHLSPDLTRAYPPRCCLVTRHSAILDFPPCGAWWRTGRGCHSPQACRTSHGLGAMGHPFGVAMPTLDGARPSPTLLPPSPHPSPFPSLTPAAPLSSSTGPPPLPHCHGLCCATEPAPPGWAHPCRVGISGGCACMPTIQSFGTTPLFCPLCKETVGGRLQCIMPSQSVIGSSCRLFGVGGGCFWPIVLVCSFCTPHGIPLECDHGNLVHPITC